MVNTCDVPGATLRALLVLIHFILITTLWSRYCYHSPWTDEEAEPWRGSRSGRRKSNSRDPGNMASVWALTDSVNSNSARVRLQSMSSYRSPSHVLSGAVLQVVIITIVLSISQVRKPGFTKWQMETPEFKSNLTASKAPSFVVFLPLKPEALAMDTKLAPRCREAWSPQLTSLADTESVRSRDQ